MSAPIRSATLESPSNDAPRIATMPSRVGGPPARHTEYAGNRQNPVRASLRLESRGVPTAGRTGQQVG
eukprot:CAMPEP_0204448988 /NCGR_PEP_ID=MMETSP0470-20130426/99408_1 /ASSEMBLY_ACC=CAM_ASM_000385 /TAXON_ID=2969 /ORGANISM="Oxyrrhis marina" /LENGTH=67 /DNA_ID=CAMNT_0051448785 /DNA_START=55 /DNA_END=254 /DNA_ORIENTATION=-